MNSTMPSAVPCGAGSPADPRRRRLLALLAGATTGATAFGDAHAHNVAGLVTPPARPPALALTLTDGRRTTLARVLDGHVSALQMMFTTCSATCPIQGATFAEARRALAAQRPEAQFVSLSIDPLGDSPQAVGAWLERHGGGARWLGGVPAVADLDRWLDFLQARQDGADRHTAQVYLFDRRGRLVMRTPDFPSAAEVVRLLLTVPD